MFNKDVDIKKFLPHRNSMLMVDDLLALTDNFVETRFLIKESNIFLGKNIFNETGLVENIAQTCSVIVGSSYFHNGDGVEENDSRVIGFITTIKSINIYKLPKINETLISKGNLLSRFDGGDYSICTLKGEVLCNDEIQLDCVLDLFIKKNNNENK